MTQDSPTLILKRLIVMKSGCRLYDERFHRGVNIIRGKNSPGKTTIASFIFYGLGGENIEWTAEQRQCDKVFLDVSANGHCFCLSREVEDNAQAPVYVHDGDYDSAHKSEKWFRFPRTRTTERESFSEWFFNELKLPQHKTDAAANLTMHQIMRLMFFDQSTSTSKILREDTTFESKDMKGAIGDYLLGLDNLEGRKIRQNIIELSKKIGEINGQVTAIHKFFGKDVKDIKQELINNTIESLRKEIDTKNNSLKLIESESYEGVEETQKEIIESLQKKARKLSDIQEAKEKKAQWLRAEINDNEIFILTLEERVVALNQSKGTDGILDEVAFKFCPLCLSPIEADRKDDSHCPLCKKERSESHATPYTQIVMELKFQIRETQSVLGNQKEEYNSICSELPHIKTALDIAQRELHNQISHVTPSQAAIESISKEIGFIEARIQQEEGKLQYATKLENFYEQKKVINESISDLEVKLDELDVLNRHRDSDIRKRIEARVLDLIRKDDGDERSFDNPQSFTFDFRADRYSLDGKQKISDSSMVILKNSLGLALFLESIIDPQMRIPKFMLFDNIEDNGMREERSGNFQRLIVAECEKMKDKGDFQLIMTTSMIDKELEGSKYCVGPFYDRNTPTLDFSKCNLLLSRY